MASSSRNWSYDVFPSFSGEDVRKTFLNHFLKELGRKLIIAFKDNDIEISQSLDPELRQAIKDSRIAVVIFSINYTSSSWCLNELLEIVKCKEEHGQVVIPVFYGLDPSHVRKQTGDFGKIFEKICQRKTKDKIIQWRRALTDVSNILGYHSVTWDNKARMVEEIANDVLDKLNLSPSNESVDFVGIEDHIRAMSSLLDLESVEKRMVGIWGPSGIGKTTIARTLFSRLSRRFQSSIFIDNFFISKSMLQRAFLAEVLYKRDMGAVEKMLKHRKTLVFIDDLDDQDVGMKNEKKNTGFFANAIADLLSTKIFICSPCGRFNSFSKFRSQIAWQTHEVAATYSASQVKRVTIGYFFDIHVKAVSPMKNTKPLVLFRVGSTLSPSSSFDNLTPHSIGSNICHLELLCHLHLEIFKHNRIVAGECQVIYIQACNQNTIVLNFDIKCMLVRTLDETFLLEVLINPSIQDIGLHAWNVVDIGNELIISILQADENISFTFYLHLRFISQSHISFHLFIELHEHAFFPTHVVACTTIKVPPVNLICFLHIVSNLIHLHHDLVLENDHHHVLDCFDHFLSCDQFSSLELARQYLLSSSSFFHKLVVIQEVAPSLLKIMSSNFCAKNLVKLIMVGSMLEKLWEGVVVK
ncbi:unnamed protein product [Brassica rapa subsp. trilocularis]